jgi:hypothetical protein
MLVLVLDLHELLDNHLPYFISSQDGSVEVLRFIIIVVKWHYVSDIQ